MNPPERPGREALRVIAVGVGVALLVGAAVLLGAGLRGTTYEGRVALLSGPSTADVPAGGAQYGEVVSLALPALAQFARSPSVLRDAAAQVPGAPVPEELARNVSVELVPASGLARLTVRAPSEAVAAGLTTAVAAAMIEADLLAPVGRLRLLDEQPEIALVQPDWPVAIGLALAAATAAGLAAVLSWRLLHRRSGVPAVRDALAAAGIERPLPVLRDDDTALTERLTMLTEAAERPVRVLAVHPGLTIRAKELHGELDAGGTAAGASVIALVPAGHKRQPELTAAAGVLPADSMLIAVVLA